jgi:hypothetical protein
MPSFAEAPSEAEGESRRVARDAVATRRGFGSPQATSQKREVAHSAIEVSLGGSDCGQPVVALTENRHRVSVHP